MPPIDSRNSTSRWAKSPGSLYLAMPYSFRPPAFSRASNTTTSWPEHRQAVRAGQAGRAGADHGDGLAGGGRALEGMAVEMRVVERVALQQADLDRLAFGVVVAHAGVLAQDLGRAHARAAPPKMFCLQDADRRAFEVAVVDVADEAGDVDAGRAGARAGRVVAVQAARAFDGGLARGERRREVGEALGQGAVRAAASGRCWSDSIMSIPFVRVIRDAAIVVPAQAGPMLSRCRRQRCEPRLRGDDGRDAVPTSSAGTRTPPRCSRCSASAASPPCAAYRSARLPARRHGGRRTGSSSSRRSC